MHVFYCDQFVLPLPAEHRFPMDKYRRLREAVVAEGIVQLEELKIPEPVDDDALRLAHDPAYVDKVVHGTLSRQEVRRIGFPWSPELVERSRRSAGGTLGACRAALTEGIAVNLAGGTHHSFADRGEGFCVFNDAAVAVRVLQDESLLDHALILDCDVHQGNGTASIFRQDPSVFTFSIHGRHNYPFHKEQSDLDVELEDRTGDREYLAALAEGLDRVFASRPAGLGRRLAIYTSGADPFEGDRLGRMELSKAALAERDRLVLGRCRAASIPVAVVMAGGYAKNTADTVEIHVATVRMARELLAARTLTAR